MLGFQITLACILLDTTTLQPTSQAFSLLLVRWSLNSTKVKESESRARKENELADRLKSSYDKLFADFEWTPRGKRIQLFHTSEGRKVSTSIMGYVCITRWIFEWPVACMCLRALELTLTNHKRKLQTEIPNPRQLEQCSLSRHNQGFKH